MTKVDFHSSMKEVPVVYAVTARTVIKALCVLQGDAEKS